MVYIKKFIKIILSKFHPIFKFLSEKYGIFKNIEEELYIYVLENRGDFNSETEINVIRARKLGVKIGKNVRILGGVSFSTEPYLIEIGDDTIITGQVLFLTHDGGVLMIRDKVPDVFGYFGKIKIGKNCFIGSRAIILPNVEIGDNCIIAAGAVVMESFPANSVIMGNPAKVAFSTEMYKKMKIFSKNTIRNTEYAYPYEEDMPYEKEKELILKKIGNLPIRRAKKSTK